MNEIIELFDMGKYDFFVWSSIGIFVAALFIDFLSAMSQNKKVKNNIKAKVKRSEAQRNKQATRSKSI